MTDSAHRFDPPSVLSGSHFVTRVEQMFGTQKGGEQKNNESVE